MDKSFIPFKFLKLSTLKHVICTLSVTSIRISKLFIVWQFNTPRGVVDNTKMTNRFCFLLQQLMVHSKLALPFVSKTLECSSSKVRYNQWEDSVQRRTTFLYVKIHNSYP